VKKLILFALAIFLIVSLSAMFVSAEETNVAAGKSYTYTGVHVDPDLNEVKYPDIGEKQLTDGEKGVKDDITYRADVWVGMSWGGEGAYSNSSVWDANTTIAQNSIVVDLGSVTDDLTRFTLITQDCGSGIVRPKEVEVLISDDNSSFTSVGKVTASNATMIVDKQDADNPEYGIYEYSYTASEAKSARYVKYTVTHGGGWLFVSEVEVYSGGETAEPTSEDPGDESEEPGDESAESEESGDESVESEDESKESDESDEPSSSAESEPDEDGLSTGAIAGIAAAALVVIGGIVYFVARKK